MIVRYRRRMGCVHHFPLMTRHSPSVVSLALSLVSWLRSRETAKSCSNSRCKFSISATGGAISRMQELSIGSSSSRGCFLWGQTHRSVAWRPDLSRRSPRRHRSRILPGFPGRPHGSGEVRPVVGVCRRSATSEDKALPRRNGARCAIKASVDLRQQRCS